MSESLDLSRVVSLIMQNPELISKISELASTGSSEQSEAEEEALPLSDEPIAEQSEPVSLPVREESRHDRRSKLLSAMKPYLSAERSRTIDTMLTVIEMVDSIKRR